MNKFSKDEATLRSELGDYSDEELSEIKDFRIHFSEECPLEFAHAFNLRRHVAEDLLATRQADQPWSIWLRKSQKHTREFYLSLGIDCAE